MIVKCVIVQIYDSTMCYCLSLFFRWHMQVDVTVHDNMCLLLLKIICSPSMIEVSISIKGTSVRKKQQCVCWQTALGILRRKNTIVVFLWYVWLRRKNTIVVFLWYVWHIRIFPQFFWSETDLNVTVPSTKHFKVKNKYSIFIGLFSISYLFFDTKKKIPYMNTTTRENNKNDKEF